MKTSYQVAVKKKSNCRKLKIKFAKKDRLNLALKSADSPNLPNRLVTIKNRANKCGKKVNSLSEASKTVSLDLKSSLKDCRPSRKAKLEMTCGGKNTNEKKRSYKSARGKLIDKPKLSIQLPINSDWFSADGSKHCLLSSSSDNIAYLDMLDNRDVAVACRIGRKKKSKSTAKTTDNGNEHGDFLGFMAETTASIPKSPSANSLCSGSDPLSVFRSLETQSLLAEMEVQVAGSLNGEYCMPSYHGRNGTIEHGAKIRKAKTVNMHYSDSTVKKKRHQHHHRSNNQFHRPSNESHGRHSNTNPLDAGVEIDMIVNSCDFEEDMSDTCIRNLLVGSAVMEHPFPIQPPSIDNNCLINGAKAHYFASSSAYLGDALSLESANLPEFLRPSTSNSNFPLSHHRPSPSPSTVTIGDADLSAVLSNQDAAFIASQNFASVSAENSYCKRFDHTDSLNNNFDVPYRESNYRYSINGDFANRFSGENHGNCSNIYANGATAPNFFSNSDFNNDWTNSGQDISCGYDADPCSNIDLCSATPKPGLIRAQTGLPTNSYVHTNRNYQANAVHSKCFPTSRNCADFVYSSNGLRHSALTPLGSRRPRKRNMKSNSGAKTKKPTKFNGHLKSAASLTFNNKEKYNYCGPPVFWHLPDEVAFDHCYGICPPERRALAITMENGVSTFNGAFGGTCMVGGCTDRTKNGWNQNDDLPWEGQSVVLVCPNGVQSGGNTQTDVNNKNGLGIVSSSSAVGSGLTRDCSFDRIKNWTVDKFAANVSNSNHHQQSSQTDNHILIENGAVLSTTETCKANTSFSAARTTDQNSFQQSRSQTLCIVNPTNDYALFVSDQMQMARPSCGQTQPATRHKNNKNCPSFVPDTFSSKPINGFCKNGKFLNNSRPFPISVSRVDPSTFTYVVNEASADCGGSPGNTKLHGEFEEERNVLAGLACSPPTSSNQIVMSNSEPGSHGNLCNKFCHPTNEYSGVLNVDRLAKSCRFNGMGTNVDSSAPQIFSHGGLISRNSVNDLFVDANYQNSNVFRPQEPNHVYDSAFNTLSFAADRVAETPALNDGRIYGNSDQNYYDYHNGFDKQNNRQSSHSFPGTRCPSRVDDPYRSNHVADQFGPNLTGGCRSAEYSPETTSMNSASSSSASDHRSLDRICDFDISKFDFALSMLSPSKSLAVSESHNTVTSSDMNLLDQFLQLASPVAIENVNDASKFASTTMGDAFSALTGDSFGWPSTAVSGRTPDESAHGSASCDELNGLRNTSFGPDNLENFSLCDYVIKNEGVGLGTNGDAINLDSYALDFIGNTRNSSLILSNLISSTTENDFAVDSKLIGIKEMLNCSVLVPDNAKDSGVSAGGNMLPLLADDSADKLPVNFLDVV